MSLTNMRSARVSDPSRTPARPSYNVPRNKCDCGLTCRASIAGAWLGLFIGFMFIFWIRWGVWRNDVEDRMNTYQREYQWTGETSCRFSNRIITYFTCYRQTCQCAELNSTTSHPCDQMLQNEVAGPCANGPTCCDGMCLTNQLCQIKSGTCSTMTQDLLIPYNDQVYRRSSTYECGFEKICEADWRTTFPLEQSRPCIFDIRDPVTSVTWGTLKKPPARPDTHKLAIIGIGVSVGFFVSVILCLLWSLYFPQVKAWCSQRKKRRLSRKRKQEPERKQKACRPIPAPPPTPHPQPCRVLL